MGALIEIGTLINKYTLEGGAYSKGGAYWKEGAQLNHYRYYWYIKHGLFHLEPVVCYHLFASILLFHCCVTVVILHKLACGILPQQVSVSIICLTMHKKT